MDPFGTFPEPSSTGIGFILATVVTKEEVAFSLAAGDDLGMDAFSQMNFARAMAVLNVRSAAGSARAQAASYNFISCLIITAQNGFGVNVVPLLSLNREMRGEEILWDAVKDISLHPSCRTRLMYAAKTGDMARLRWLVARGAQLEKVDSMNNTALWWACLKGCDDAAALLVQLGAASSIPPTWESWLRECSSLRALSNV